MKDKLHSKKNRAGRSLLIINSGSSSLKFAVYPRRAPAREILSGKIDRIGKSGAVFSWRDPRDSGREPVRCPDHNAAGKLLLKSLASRPDLGKLEAIGHRVVHGGAKYTSPTLATPELLAELRRITPYDPQHLRAQIMLIETFARHCPSTPQVACFDTSFHAAMPMVAQMLPIPRHFHADGVRRYGFHGLSYAWLMQRLERLDAKSAQRGRIVLAHLGNGASLAAVRNGKSIDTTMAFTPAAGVPMSCRSGDLDPGLFLFLSRQRGMTPEQFQHMVNYESGLLGVSETSSDLRDLWQRQESDPRAAQAIDLFCYHVKKAIGAYAAALGGLDLLVFAGGIGENDPKVRARVCDGLEFLGLRLDPARNQSGAPIISASRSRVPVRVIATNEERMIAQYVRQLLDHGPQTQPTASHEKTAVR